MEVSSPAAYTDEGFFWIDEYVWPYTRIGNHYIAHSKLQIIFKIKFFKNKIDAEASVGYKPVRDLFLKWSR